MFNQYFPYVIGAFIGGGAVGFGVAFWVYHKNKVARAAAQAQADFEALVAKVKASIQG